MTAKPKASKAVRPRRSPRRTQGRPLIEVEVGRQALIDAASALLRTTPPARITRAAIARFAGVDPGLIRYYFGDRDGLFAEGVHRRTHHVADRPTRIKTDGQHPVAQVAVGNNAREAAGIAKQ